MSLERTLAFLASQEAKQSNQAHPTLNPAPNTDSSSQKIDAKQLRRHSNAPSSAQPQPQPSSSLQTNPQSAKKPDKSKTNLLEAEDDLEASEANQWRDFGMRIRAIQNNEVSLLPLDSKIKKDMFVMGTFSISARLIDLCNHYVNHVHPLFGKHDDNAKFLKKLILLLQTSNTDEYCSDQSLRAFYNYILIGAFIRYLIDQKSNAFSNLLNSFLLKSTFEDEQKKQIYLFPEKSNLPPKIQKLITQLSAVFTKKNDKDRSQFWKNFLTTPELNNIIKQISQPEKKSNARPSKTSSIKIESSLASSQGQNNDISFFEKQIPTEKITPEKNMDHSKTSEANSPPSKDCFSGKFDTSDTIDKNDPGIAGTSEKKQESEKSDTLSNATGSNTRMVSNVIPNMASNKVSDEVSDLVSDDVAAEGSNSVSTPISNQFSVVTHSLLNEINPSNQGSVSKAPEENPGKIQIIFGRNTQ